MPCWCLLHCAWLQQTFSTQKCASSALHTHALTFVVAPLGCACHSVSAPQALGLRWRPITFTFALWWQHLRFMAALLRQPTQISPKHVIDFCWKPLMHAAAQVSGFPPQLQWEILEIIAWFRQVTSACANETCLGSAFHGLPCWGWGRYKHKHWDQTWQRMTPSTSPQWVVLQSTQFFVLLPTPSNLRTRRTSRTNHTDPSEYIPTNSTSINTSQCYSSFDLSSIYAVKYHLTTRIRLYQPSFLISTIPGPRYRLSRILGLTRYLDT